MSIEKNIKELLGDWNNPAIIENFIGGKDHKFLDRNRTLEINWSRLHAYAPEILFDNKKNKILDVACGNGATMEIFRFYGHDCQGIDFSPGFGKDDWLYKPLIDSQKLSCIVHDGASLPYPFKDKEFDFLICYGAITFFKPVENWQNVLNEFARLSKKSFVVGVNVGPVYEQGKPYIENWLHPDFSLQLQYGSIYKWVRK
jgi:ubiquinone/menaquinone biosynthesis C-methylase UbiE